MDKANNENSRILAETLNGFVASARNLSTKNGPATVLEVIKESGFKQTIWIKPQVQENLLPKPKQDITIETYIIL